MLGKLYTYENGSCIIILLNYYGRSLWLCSLTLNDIFGFILHMFRIRHDFELLELVFK